jgi:hypothetical protein
MFGDLVHDEVAKQTRWCHTVPHRHALELAYEIDAVRQRPIIDDLSTNKGIALRHLLTLRHADALFGFHHVHIEASAPWCTEAFWIGRCHVRITDLVLRPVFLSAH